MNSLPPLNSLRAFEAAARHGNFTRAAEELGVTQSAVSRQIATLEDFLGIQLFTRSRGEVILTPAALRYEPELARAFSIIMTATENLPNLPNRRAINIRSMPGVLHTWLLPRIGEFRTMHPNVRLNFSSSMNFILADRERIDISIQGPPTPDQAGITLEPFMQNRVAPVCSPAYLKRVGPISSPKEFSKHTILDACFRRNDWSEWLSMVGAPETPFPNILTFESSSMVYVAAKEGLGIAMGQLPLIQREIERGDLVQVFESSIVLNPLLYVGYSHRSVNLASVGAFREWLMKEADKSVNWFTESGS